MHSHTIQMLSHTCYRIPARRSHGSTSPSLRGSGSRTPTAVPTRVVPSVLPEVHPEVTTVLWGFKATNKRSRLKKELKKEGDDRMRERERELHQKRTGQDPECGLGPRLESLGCAPKHANGLVMDVSVRCSF